ncbi:MAG: cysteine--tRNA ligase [Patescibacteria group bacterium]|jgi:cysteinyl-tRNA synthetase
MKLFNTLSSKSEEFKPIDPEKVTLYTCGPTVYDVAHIGNLRALLTYDLLKRALAAEGYNVVHAMNLTDIDDKTIKRSEGEKEAFSKLIKLYEDRVWQDEKELNIIKPSIVTRATEYIDKMVVFVESLISNGYAYKADDGSVYFSIDKFKNYGQLSKLDKEGIKSGARVAQDDYDKENPADFVLWKAWSEKDGEIFWETSLGKGRPGWHLECSVMAGDVLGNTIDIHAGGVDLIFPHHENEIAQSEAKTGKKFVNFWVHNEHLMVDGRKMSKSLNNFYTLDNIVAKGFSPLDFRYFVLAAHYRSKLNFTWEGLEAAKNARERLNRVASQISGGEAEGQRDKKYLDRFNEKISNDLNTPEALAILWELMRDENVSQADKNATIAEMDKVFGLGLLENQTFEIPAEVIKIAEERKTAREAKDFAKSDELRDQIIEAGWQIEDFPNNEYKIIKK